MKIAARRFLAKRFFMGDANGRTRSLARYVRPTAPQGGCSLSTAIPHAPRASGLRDPPQDKADQHKDGSEQDERERVGPVVRDHRGTRVRRAMRRSRSTLSPRNARALAHRIMQAGPLLGGGVRQDRPHEEDGRRQQQRQCLNGPHDRPPPSRASVISVGDEHARRAWCEGLDGRAGRSGRSASLSPPKSHATTAGPIGIKNPDVTPVMPSTR